MTALAPTLQSFFTEYLIGQRGASRHTIAAYRDTFRLLLGYIRERTGVRPSDVDIAIVDAALVAEFLTVLERQRHNAVSTRNARLAAIHSLFGYAALRHPEHADQIARVLAIPTKNSDQTVVCWLTDPEVEALLDAPDTSTWTGRRDQLLLQVLVRTGMRVSELTALSWADTFTEKRGGHVACRGKGRKDRVTPIDRATAVALRRWFTENQPEVAAPVFSTRGTTRRMSTDAVAQRVSLYAAAAAAVCPSLGAKHPTPHTLRHTCAMQMLAAGIDAPTIALWLGHESLASTSRYVHADLALKQRALDRTAPPRTRRGRYRPPDKLVAFLSAL
ncbi:MAG: tyrosine-type recombinase/integrase [Acidimicrobiales bacterium]